jgi:ABC-2 type transport system ATP-binding protein
MTVLEYLRFVAELKKIPKKERRDQIASVLKMTMLGDYQERLIRNLSKGYKQRVGLAQALIGFPEIIILDEPTVGLDPQQILEIRDLIRSLKNDHIIMLSSHILSEVNEVCDEVMILSHGKLVASGSPAELEAKMQKKSSLNLTVLGDEESTRAALAAVPGIDQMTFGETAEDGALSVVLESDGDTDIRTEVARALAAAAIPVTGMQLETRSLEDVFLELTGSDNEGTLTESADASKPADSAEHSSAAAAEVSDEDTESGEEELS